MKNKTLEEWKQLAIVRGITLKNLAHIALEENRGYALNEVIRVLIAEGWIVAKDKDPAVGEE